MKRLFQVLAISAVILTGLAASASAQTVSTATKIKVDFDFTVRDQVFPAGQYRIKKIDNNQTHLLLVQRLDGNGQAVIATIPSQNRGKYAVGDVAFNKYGDKYFLANVQVGDSDTFHQVMKSRAERNIQRMSVKIAGIDAERVIIPTTGQ